MMTAERRPGVLAVAGDVVGAAVLVLLLPLALVIAASPIILIVRIVLAIGGALLEQ